ncbi:MAG: tetratricopeptide repeat protein, partial [Planctomycetes bacterium]|nr:tetratricopeptide repeat protein [Planctomycetota bacterium]
MKILLTTIAVWAVAMGGGDRELGLELYAEGRYAEAQAAFARALKQEPDSAELQWNLALAAWRAGDLATAEVAAEKYAA